MAGKTFYESLMERQAETAKYKGKLIIKKKDIEWHVSPQGRNAAIVDATTGLEAKTFGVLMSEIPPGSQSGLHKHTFEAVVYVLGGEGYEIIGDERIEWEEGDTFYLPPNVVHRHVNRSSTKPAKLLLIETWPLTIALGISELIQTEGAGKVPGVKAAE